MSLIMIAIHDRATNSYQRPLCVRAIGEGIRWFQDEINTPQSQMNKHADDYDLFQIGTYDEQTGTINPEERPVQLAMGKQLKTGE